jgi:precorrin-2 dehydrogenase/sirohydrochlorin ferrochelatase
MYPVVFPPTGLNVVLAGAGEAAARRLDGLDAAGATVRVFSPERDDALARAAGARLTARLPEAADLAGARLMLVAGLDDEVSARLAALARGAGIPVNVEDRPALCDFHVPAVVRRGDLLLTVSTGGTAPGLAARLRQRLERLFGPEWGERLAALARARAEWKAEGADMAALRRRTREWLDRQGWFD